VLKEKLRAKKTIRLENLNVIKINPKYGYAVLPKSLDFEEDKIYDKLLKQS
jgi:hypothetical protein